MLRSSPILTIDVDREFYLLGVFPLGAARNSGFSGGIHALRAGIAVYPGKTAGNIPAQDGATRKGSDLRVSIFLQICCLGVILLLLTPSYAWAYVDPGTGSYLFQLAAAGFLAGAYTLRRYWHALTTTMRSLFDRKSSR